MNLSQPEQNPNPKKKGKKLVCSLITLLLVGAAFLFAIWFFGSQHSHQWIKHPLYSAFDQSPQHKQLLVQLAKSKKSILIGKKEDGVIQFAEHFANTVSRSNKAVYIEDYNKDHFEYYQIAREVKTQIGQLIGQAPPTGDWIVLSESGHQIPLQIISNIQLNPLNGKILVVSSSPLKIKGFKQFAFPAVSEKLLESTIAKSLNLKPAVADILHDYLKTPEQIYENLDDETFDQKALLGENHRPLSELSKQEKTALQTLCKKGVVKSSQENPKLTSLGIIHFEGSNYWRSNQAILNYELQAEVNCKNTLAPQKVLKLQQEKEAREAEAKRQEQQRREQQQQEEEQRRAQEKKKASAAGKAAGKTKAKK